MNSNAIIHEPFGFELKTFLTNMDWIGLANITEDKYRTHLVNEFYSGILVKRSDLNLPMWDPDLLYTDFNDRDFCHNGFPPRLGGLPKIKMELPPIFSVRV